jgi:hypothetical protein
LHGLHPLPSPPKAASGAQEQPSKQKSNAFTRHIPSSTMAIAAPAPIPNPIPDPIAGNSVMPESTASMPPTSHNVWRSISANLVMPDEFESMMHKIGATRRETTSLEMPPEQKVGRNVCQHGRQRSRCKECGGGAICQHGRVKSVCKECGGSSICQHGRVKSVCKECGGGGSICQHGKQRRTCKECGKAHRTQTEVRFPVVLTHVLC